MQTALLSQRMAEASIGTLSCGIQCSISRGAVNAHNNGTATAQPRTGNELTGYRDCHLMTGSSVSGGALHCCSSYGCTVAQLSLVMSDERSSLSIAACDCNGIASLYRNFDCSDLLCYLTIADTAQSQRYNGIKLPDTATCVCCNTICSGGDEIPETSNEAAGIQTVTTADWPTRVWPNVDTIQSIDGQCSNGSNQTFHSDQYFHGVDSNAGEASAEYHDLPYMDPDADVASVGHHDLTLNHSDSNDANSAYSKAGTGGAEHYTDQTSEGSIEAHTINAEFNTDHTSGGSHAVRSTAEYAHVRHAGQSALADGSAAESHKMVDQYPNDVNPGTDAMQAQLDADSASESTAAIGETNECRSIVADDKAVGYGQVIDVKCTNMSNFDESDKTVEPGCNETSAGLNAQSRTDGESDGLGVADTQCAEEQIIVEDDGVKLVGENAEGAILAAFGDMRNVQMARSVEMNFQEPEVLTMLNEQLSKSDDADSNAELGNDHISQGSEAEVADGNNIIADNGAAGQQEVSSNQTNGFTSDLHIKQSNCKQLTGSNIQRAGFQTVVFPAIYFFHFRA